MSLIRIEGLSVAFSGQTVLQNVSFHVDASEIVTIVGPNGSGKSTLLRSMIGALPTAGATITKKPGLKIGYVPQRLTLDPTLPLTVRRFLDLPSPAPKGAAETALTRAGVSGLANRQMSALSGGQLQRVLLARAILHMPDLLLLDEATQGLDQPGSAAFYRQIEEVRREMGVGVVMVSHELHVVMAASDRVICLNGHVCCEGAPEHVATAPEYRALFGTGTQGALALYRHEHDHAHDPSHGHHDHAHDHTHANEGADG